MTHVEIKLKQGSLILMNCLRWPCFNLLSNYDKYYLNYTCHAFALNTLKNCAVIHKMIKCILKIAINVIKVPRVF
jgi:hypothetical protein